MSKAKFYSNPHFHKHLLKDIPELGHEEAEDQEALVHLAWDCQTGRFKHTSLGYKGYSFIPHQLLALLFDRGRRRGRFHKINSRVKMFEMLNRYSHGEARPYRLAPTVTEAYWSYSKALPKEPIDLITKNGRVVRTLKNRNGIRSKDANNRTAQTKCKIKPYCPVDVIALNNARTLITATHDQFYRGEKTRLLQSSWICSGMTGPNTAI